MTGVVYVLLLGQREGKGGQVAAAAEGLVESYYGVLCVFTGRGEMGGGGVTTAV